MSAEGALAKVIWDASRADEGSISAMNADKVAAAIHAAGWNPPKPKLGEFQEGVASTLESAADTFRERAVVYKDNFRKVGAVMAALFPEGMTLKTPEDYNRWHLFELAIVKLTRYTNNYSEGGHADSVTDLIVYMAMVQGLDLETAAAAIGDLFPEEEDEDDF